MSIVIVKTAKKYIDYWTTPAPEPRSIAFLEALAKKLHVQWRPTDGTAFFVAQQAANDETNYYENQLAEYDPEKNSEGIDADKLEEAHLSEIRHRIFKAIYWGNLYDDLMPIEARSFATTGQRKAKLTLMVIAASLLYSALYLLPSLVYGVGLSTDALFKTSSQQLHHFSTPELGQSYHDALVAEGISLPPVSITDAEVALSEAKSYKVSLLALVRTSSVSSVDLIGSPIWKVASEDQRERLLADVLFFHLMTTDANALETLNRSTKIVTAPLGNLQELATQLVLLALAMILISWFLSKKNYFFDVIADVDKNRRTAAIISLEETILGNFFFRKKFHYAVALGLTATVILVHYLTIDGSFNSVSAPAATVLDLKAFDYRISPSTVPTVVVNWGLQLVLGYTLALVGWELKLLNECMKIWQVKFIEISIFDQSAYDKCFQRLSENQLSHLVSLAGVTVVPLMVFSFVKWLYLYPPVDLSTLGLDRFVLSDPLAFLADVNFWVLWTVVYTVAPPLVVGILIAMTGRTCLPSVEETKKFKEKRAVGMDSSIEYIWKRGEKIVGLEKMWDKLGLEAGRQLQPAEKEQSTSNEKSSDDDKTEEE